MDPKHRRWIQRRKYELGARERGKGLREEVNHLAA